MPKKNNTPVSSRFFERHPRLTLLAISLLLVWGIDALAGLLLIPFNYQAFRRPHYYYHHDLRPGVAAKTMWGPVVYPMTTNSLGFRDSATTRLTLEKSGQKRILLLGDSHTEAVGVRYEDSFAGILARQLKTNNIEILNAAAISYSPRIHYLKAHYLLDYAGLEVDEILVFIDMSDIQNEIVYEKFQPAQYSFFRQTWEDFKQFSQRNSFIIFTVSSIRRAKETARFVERAKQFNEAGMASNTTELYASFFTDFDDNTMLSNPNFHGVGEWIYNENFKPLALKGITLGQQNIMKLKALCDTKGIGLTISVHPWQSQIQRGDTSNAYTEAWRTFAVENRIGFLNLYPLFINAENPYIAATENYLPFDNHWNENGHRKVAEYLVPQILNKLKNND